MLSIFSVVVATSVLEILRAILNRFSSSFYKRGGRAAIGLRAVSGIVVLILFQALFYPSVYEHFLGIITSTLGPTWFVPILWASVSVTSYLAGQFTNSLLFRSAHSFSRRSFVFCSRGSEIQVLGTHAAIDHHFFCSLFPESRLWFRDS